MENEKQILLGGIELSHLRIRSESIDKDNHS